MYITEFLNFNNFPLFGPLIIQSNPTTRATYYIHCVSEGVIRQLKRSAECKTKFITLALLYLPTYGNVNFSRIRLWVKRKLENCNTFQFWDVNIGLNCFIHLFDLNMFYVGHKIAIVFDYKLTLFPGSSYKFK